MITGGSTRMGMGMTTLVRAVSKSAWKKNTLLKVIVFLLEFKY